MNSEPMHQSVMDLARQDQDARAHFLAKRYAGLASLEDDARFHLLSERLRHLVPRVTALDIDQLDQEVRSLEDNAAFLAQLESELNED